MVSGSLCGDSSRFGNNSLFFDNCAVFDTRSYQAIHLFQLLEMSNIDDMLPWGNALQYKTKTQIPQGLYIAPGKQKPSDFGQRVSFHLFCFE